MDCSIDLPAILASHAKSLAGEEGGERVNLSDANLSGANLIGANLFGANLRGVILNRVDTLTERQILARFGVRVKNA